MLMSFFIFSLFNCFLIDDFDIILFIHEDNSYKRCIWKYDLFQVIANSEHDDVEHHNHDHLDYQDTIPGHQNDHTYQQLIDGDSEDDCDDDLFNVNQRHDNDYQNAIAVYENDHNLEVIAGNGDRYDDHDYLEVIADSVDDEEDIYDTIPDRDTSPDHYSYVGNDVSQFQIEEIPRLPTRSLHTSTKWIVVNNEII